MLATVAPRLASHKWRIVRAWERGAGQLWVVALAGVTPFALALFAVLHLGAPACVACVQVSTRQYPTGIRR